MTNGTKGRRKLLDLACLLPAFVFLISILLVRFHQFSMPLTDIYWTSAVDSTVLTDLFGYWKCVAILVAGFLAVLVMIVAYFKEAILYKKSFLYIPVCIYIAFVFISLAFSSYKYFAIHGMQEHFEGTFVLLTYMIMVVFLFNAIDNERRLKYVIYLTLAVALLAGLLGVTQAIGQDFFTTVIGQKLITPNATWENGIKAWEYIDLYHAMGQTIYDFVFTDGQVYQTVYNINYVSMYLSLIIPVSAAMFIYYSNHSDKLSAGLSLVAFTLTLYNLFSANSAAGYVGVFIIAIVAFLVFGKYVRKWKKQILCIVLIGLMIMCATADRWLGEVKYAIDPLSSIIAERVFADGAPTESLIFENDPAGKWVPIDYIETNRGYMDFKINGSILRITRDDEQNAFLFADSEGDLVYLQNIDGEEGVFQFLDERFHDYIKVSVFVTEEYPIVLLYTMTNSWTFVYCDEAFYYINNQGKFVSLTNVPHANLFKNYRLGSNRGRIWDTTLPMLKNSIVYGVGADCYAFEYPQNDYVTIYNKYNRNWFNVVTDKAHNLYLQYWVNTGLISLLAWLTMVGYYLVGAAKQFRKRGFEDFCDFVNGGIFCGIIGFLAIAFFNDGSVNTMPMFYTMLGTGLAINARDKWPEAANVSQSARI